MNQNIILKRDRIKMYLLLTFCKGSNWFSYFIFKNFPCVSEKNKQPYNKCSSKTEPKLFLQDKVIPSKRRYPSSVTNKLHHSLTLKNKLYLDTSTF